MLLLLFRLGMKNANFPSLFRQLQSPDNWGVLADDEEVKQAVIYKLELQMQLKSESLEATFDDLVRESPPQPLQPLFASASPLHYRSFFISANNTARQKPH